MKNTLRAAWRLYTTNFIPLMKTLLVQLILRAIALTPLMFLADKALAPLAWLAVPVYLLIVLPARQNVALALQDLLHGGDLFSTRLIETKDYGRKLLRGLKGTLCMLLWSAVTIAGIVWLALAFTGSGGMDGFTLLRLFSSAGKIIGGKTMEGAFLIIGGIAATSILALVGCAVHCGARHAIAKGDKQVLKGKRGGLSGLWLLSLVLLLPFVIAVALTLGDWAIGALKGFLNTFQFSAMAITGRQVWSIVVAAVALLLPVIPFRTLLPAVYLHDKEAE